MAEINPKLLDKIIRFQVDLRRLEASERKKIEKIVKQIEKGVLARLSGDEIATFNKRKLSALLTSISEPVSEAFAQMQDAAAETLDGIAKLQIKTAAANINEVFIGYNAALPPAAVISGITANTLINGGPLADWWAKQESDTIFKFSSAIRQGMVLGENNQQIVRRIIGTRTQPGLLDLTRNNASALVHTAIQTVANNARQAVYEQNSDVIQAFSWFSAMDSHVCPQCMALSGREWKNDKGNTPIGHSVPFQLPPIHFNDRCVLLPVTKTFKQLGLDLPKLPPGERASSLGPISADTTFDQYLQRVPKTQQDEMLGKGRADLFREGKISLNQLLDGQGRELTLKELQQKYN